MSDNELDLFCQRVAHVIDSFRTHTDYHEHLTTIIIRLDLLLEGARSHEEEHHAK